MDKEQASAAADALLAMARANRPAHVPRKQSRPSRRTFGISLMGMGVGIILGHASGNVLLFGAIGFSLAYSLATRSGRQS